MRKSLTKEASNTRARRAWHAAARSLSVLSLALFAAGCAHTRGPALVVNSHLDYNQAVSQVLKEELLLNVVRRRYMEAPQFLNISSINTNFSRTISAGAAASVGDIGGGNVVGADADGSITFSDSPTITVTPRQGEDIATQLHQPISVDRIADLLGAGYGIHTIFDTLVRGINNLRGPELRHETFKPGSLQWREVLAALTTLYDDGSLLLERFRWNDPYNDFAFPAESITPEMWITTLSTGAKRWKSWDGGKTFFFTTHEMAPAIWMSPEARNSPEGELLIDRLNVQPDPLKQIWVLEPARVGGGPDIAGRPDDPRGTLKLRMRSLYNVLNFYAYGVHVPPQDEINGEATDLRDRKSVV